MIALVLGILYFRQVLDQAGVMNITGVLFLFLTTMTFQNFFAVVNVSITIIYDNKYMYYCLKIDTFNFSIFKQIFLVNFKLLFLGFLFGASNFHARTPEWNVPN